MPSFSPEPGVALHYVDAPGARPPVVLVHGWSMSSAAFAAQLDALASAGHRVLALDLRGHGRSSPAARYLVEDHARDLAALFERESLSRAVLVGWSLGGQVALEALPALGDRVAALALLSATPRFTQGDDWPHGLAASSVRALAARVARRPEQALRRFFDAMFAPGELEAAARERLAARVVAGPGAPGQDAAAALAGLDAFLAADQRPRLAAARAPALLVHGLDDAICLPAASRFMHERLPGSRLELLAGLGHAPHLSRPALVSELIVRFASEALA
jgi:pimeloyl-[acyl-carrier protein] methyl ester esterase